MPLGGVDNVVLNNIASTVRKGGMLTTSEGGYYLWKFGDIVLYKVRRAVCGMYARVLNAI